MATDVTTEHGTTESLSRNRKTLETALRIARMGSWELDLETGEETWTEGLHGLLGDDDRHLVPGRTTMARLVHPGDLRRVEAALDQTIATGVVRDLVYRLERLDGSEHTLVSHLVPEKDHGGRVRRLTGFEQDVTDSLRAADELREKRAAIETATNGIVICNRAGIILRANAAFRDLLGLEPGTTVGVPLERFCTDPKEGERVRREIASNRCVRTELTVRRPDGRLVWVDVAGASIPERERAVSGWVFSCADISEKKADRELRRRLLERVMTAQEDERLRMAREFHDGVGQVLTSVLVGLRSLEEERRPARVKQLARQLRGIVGQALDDVRRLSRGLHPLNLGELGFGPVAAHHTLTFSRVHRIPVRLDTSRLAGRRLPSAVETALYRILQEALTNVARHASARSVSVVAACSKLGVSIDIEDDGQGFDPDRLFASRPSGASLGLFGMRERTTQLGGNFELNTSPGAGTRIHVEIPLAGGPEA
ncbi:MAG: PAS domain-containing sensor histidine kinase [Thermoanaerobaculia bacterium]